MAVVVAGEVEEEEEEAVAEVVEEVVVLEVEEEEVGASEEEEEEAADSEVSATRDVFKRLNCRVMLLLVYFPPPTSIENTDVPGFIYGSLPHNSLLLFPNFSPNYLLFLFVSFTKPPNYFLVLII